MEKLLVLVFVACLVGSSYQESDDLVKRLINLLTEKQEEKRTETVGEIMKRVMTDFDMEKRHSCDNYCGSNSNYKISISKDKCLCYNKRSDYEKRGCNKDCQDAGMGEYGVDINGKGCNCLSKREMVEQRAHSCASQCGENDYMVNIDGLECQCLKGNGQRALEKPGCNERCKGQNYLWGYDIGNGCQCLYQRDLVRRVNKCEDSSDCADDSYCADIGNSNNQHCMGSRELEYQVRCSRCSKDEVCMEVGKKGLRCLKRRDMEALVSRVLEDGN